MGHGDDICFGDAHFPSQSVGSAARVMRYDGHKITDLLDAVLQFLPLDSYVDQPVSLMQQLNEEEPAPKVWEEYRGIIEKNDFCHAFNVFLGCGDVRLRRPDGGHRCGGAGLRRAPR